MSEITVEEKFLFDLHGCLLLKEVLTAAECQAYLQTIERLKVREYDESWQDSVVIPPEISTYGPPLPTCDRSRAGAIRFNGMPNLDPIFDGPIAHSRLLPYLREFVGRPQLINSWAIEKLKSGDAGWHRGIQPVDYTYRADVIRTRMLNVVFFLTDNGPDDGCMVAIPGSHKNNIDLDWGKYKNLEMPGSMAITGNAGDVFLFSEAVMHDGLPKTNDTVRTNLYYNYASFDFNVMIYEPQNNHHFRLSPEVRARFTPEQKAITRWMDYAEIPSAIV